LSRGDFGRVDCALALDLTLPDLAFGSDAAFCYRLLVGDARTLDGLAGGDLRALGLGVALGALARKLGTLLGAPEFNIALLFEPCLFARPLDLKRLLLRLEV